MGRSWPVTLKKGSWSRKETQPGGHRVNYLTMDNLTLKTSAGWQSHIVGRLRGALYTANTHRLEWLVPVDNTRHSVTIPSPNSGPIGGLDKLHYICKSYSHVNLRFLNSEQLHLQSDWLGCETGHHQCPFMSDPNMGTPTCPLRILRRKTRIFIFLVLSNSSGSGPKILFMSLITFQVYERTPISFLKSFEADHSANSLNFFSMKIFIWIYQEYMT